MSVSEHHRSVRCLGFAFMVLSFAVSSTACSPSKPSNGPDSATVAQDLADSVAKVELQQAADLSEAARAALASLLKDPASATFDSLTVMQPPPVDGRPSPMVVCGRIRGKPGIGGRSGPAAFVYQNRMTVFVEDASNKEAFGEVWNETCGHSQARVIAG